MEPISFTPLYMERVWGGRSLETVYGRELPNETAPFGESWELTDRAEEQSVVASGPYEGQTLNALWTQKREEVFGPGLPESERFPLLIKILDAQNVLSVQVHPPASVADELGGEPKTEMWYVADAAQDATLYVGVKEGVNASQFSTAIEEGTVEECIHAIKPKVGQSIHIESGRLHAIGAGLLIYEIQQNSDTTYRVFDWNRVGLDGVPRQLHLEESMKCIDFGDYEPEMDQPQGTELASCPHYQVDKHSVEDQSTVALSSPAHFAIFSVVSGSLISAGGSEFTAGDFFIMPAGASPLTAKGATSYLETTLPLGS